MSESQDRSTEAQPRVKREPLPMRAVVLLPPGAAGEVMPGDLLTGLSGRGLAVEVVHEASEVMASLAATPAIAVMLVSPQQHDRGEELREALRAYHGRTACWVYLPAEPGEKPRVMNYDAWKQPTTDSVGTTSAAKEPAVGEKAAPQGGDDGADAEFEHAPLPFVMPEADPEPVAEEVETPLAPMSPSETRAVDRIQKLLVKVSPDQERSAAVVSEEELTMLLGPVPGEAADHG